MSEHQISRVNAARLVELAQEIGVDPVYLEKDFVLAEVIYSYATGPFQDVLVLKGGQVLRHVYDSARLSRDIDYVARRRVEFDELRDSLKVRYPRLAFPEKPVGRTAHGLLIRPIAYRGPLGNRDSVELEVSFRGDLVLEPDRVAYRSPFREPFPVLVMQVDEMIAEKVRALYQRGNARDLYDLWFVFTHPEIKPDFQVIAGLIPRKFRSPLVAGGWDRGRLYDRVREEAGLWDQSLRALVPNYPSFDEALAVVERALRSLPK